MKVQGKESTEDIFKGFFSAIKRVKSHFGIERFIYAMDSSNNFRKVIYPDYKGNRDDKSEILIEALDNIEHFISTGMRSYGYKVDTFEADDIIATMCHRFFFGEKNLILSGDKDLMQLLNENTHAAIGVGKTRHDIITPETIYEKFGIPPEFISTYLSLLGDSVDNFKGIEGVGPKTAVKLIEKYKSYDNIIKHAHEIKPVKIGAAIQAMDDPFLPKKLAELRYNVPVELQRNTLDETVVKHYRHKFKL
jgi:DNA polymerase-1